MAKNVTKIIKLQISAGKATPAPPVGTALGPHGLNIQDFCSKFNEATRDKMGSIIPVEVSVYEDRTFTFKFKSSPASDMLRKAAGIEKGSGETPRVKAGKVTKTQIRQIAEAKIQDLNANDIEGAVKIIEGTARSMGISVE